MNFWDWLLCAAGVWALFDIATQITHSARELTRIRKQTERIADELELINADDGDA